MDVSNFYIVLYDKASNRIKFPFYLDEYDNLEEYHIVYLSTNSLTNEVFQTLALIFLKKKDLL
jgi:hypothetical protein